MKPSIQYPEYISKVNSAEERPGQVDPTQVGGAQIGLGRGFDDGGVVLDLVGLEDHRILLDAGLRESGRCEQAQRTLI